jgi:hypothetical protein
VKRAHIPAALRGLATGSGWPLSRPERSLSAGSITLAVMVTGWRLTPTTNELLASESDICRGMASNGAGIVKVQTPGS